MTRAELHKLVDELPETAVDGAAVLLRGIVSGPVDPDQAWFWTTEWQRKEREAEAEKTAGRADRYDSDDAFLAALDERSGRRMPTYDVLASFWRDWRSLTPQQQFAFRRVLQQFIADLRSGTLRPALRVKRVQGYPCVWELSWAADGRATFEYAEEIGGEPHIIWRRIGTHDIFRRP